ncbi:AP-4 complex subunit sigma, putative [Hepatocystis sp. ex Piliocolobus tephrosceles]|nr:AP-4 complex subunit sigma, putative [Hepatocystis sp. ex Piliocolobus tephrosceles]
MIEFLLMVNKQGQTRLSQYYNDLTIEEKTILEGELIRKCLSRVDYQCSFLQFREYKIIYRRYASLYLIVGVINQDVNEFAILEMIHNIIEILDKYYENVCELDIMFNIDRTHFIINEIICNGEIVDMNKTNVLKPILLMDKFSVKT